jgi:hypothetical protein
MWDEDPRIRMLKQIEDPYTWEGINTIDRPRLQEMARRMMGVSMGDDYEKHRQFDEQMRLQEVSGLAKAHEQTRSPLGGQSAAGNALAKIIGDRYHVPSMYSYRGL